MAANNTKDEAIEVVLKVLLEIMKKEVLTSEYCHVDYLIFMSLQGGIYTHDEIS
jgi:hypothetical protein